MKKALFQTSKETHQRKKRSKSLDGLCITRFQHQKDTFRSLIKQDQDTPKGKKRSYEEESGQKKDHKSLQT